MQISVEAARDLAVAAFCRLGVRHDDAVTAADPLVLTEMMGLPTHGLSRVITYCDRIKAGGIDPDAVIEVRAPTLALRHVDGHDGLGPVTAMRCVTEAQAAARAAGVGAVFVRGATHVGALVPYLWHATQSGCAAVITTATAPMIAPAGGREALIGNNPIGIGVPIEGRDPVLLDMALSMVSRSRVRAARDAGREIPSDWALDASGHPTTDPKAALEGVLQAIGGPKGANLSLCLDLFAASLGGGKLLGRIADQHKDPSRRQGFSMMFLLVDQTALRDIAEPDANVRDALDQVEQSAPADPDKPVRLPGARAVAAMREAEQRGLSVPAPLLDQLKSLAGA
ncbi:Ldh family oxidoreductase [uncultured Marivita sp.]|uniref:Ldh family oxidoreductase n=1 Tax=uncultured Marivita sp. TaxID=888080 RepID=UPI00260CE4B1|nr:Ldh family oxidoreductase [uncultured Marivita sp.]